jgi:threonine dehydrogenase-like Zn-dependent dehydrogenase
MCICGSDLWPYRGLQPLEGPSQMGHEYCGVVVEVGSDVKTVRSGLVLSVRQHLYALPLRLPVVLHAREFMTGAQAPYARVRQLQAPMHAT